MEAGKDGALAAHIELLGSLDAEERLQALEAIRRYAGNRKVDQAVFELRNDSDRRVRILAREILDEGEKRTSESLSIPGAEDRAQAERMEELIAALADKDPTDRVTAIKELRAIDHPKAIAAVERMKKDPNRVVRMLAEKSVEERAFNAARSTTTNQFRKGVLVASPYTERARRKSGEEPRSGGSIASTLVTPIGLVYLVLGVPLAALWLWFWMTEFALLPPEFPDASSARVFVETKTSVELDVLKLSLLFWLSAWLGIAGAGLTLGREWARRATLSWHLVMMLVSLVLPSLAAKLVSGVVNLLLFYLFTRPEIIEAFNGRDEADEEPPPSADYGTTERKVW